MIYDNVIVTSHENYNRLTRGIHNTLAVICENENISRAEAIRRAVGAYIKQKRNGNKNRKSAFGLWSNRNIEATFYVDNLRKEWE